MGLWFVFFLGIGNFAAHRAVLESRHPLLVEIPWFFGRFSLAIEFAMLLGAMLMIASGSLTWAMLYGGYSLVNLGSAWLILTRRI